MRLTEQWWGIPRWLFLAAAAIVGINLLSLGAAAVGGGTSGPTSSGFATAPDGLAGYSSLLERSGHPVSYQEADPADEPPSTGTTMVVLDPESLPDETASAIGDFVRSGGRLIAGGKRSSEWVERTLGSAPLWGPIPTGSNRALVPVEETSGVALVSGASGAWSDAGSTLPIVGSSAFSLVAVTDVGEGRVVLFADAAPLQNAALGEADNAALGLSAAGETGRPVVFLESVHGFGTERGFAAIPSDWRWMLVGWGMAMLALMWAVGKRLGPPERPGRELPPPRRVYVESLAGAIQRTRDKEAALHPVRAHALEKLAWTYGLGDRPDPGALRRAAKQAGLDHLEIEALLRSGESDVDALSAGRAMFRLRGGL